MAISREVVKYVKQNAMVIGQMAKNGNDVAIRVCEMIRIYHKNPNNIANQVLLETVIEEYMINVGEVVP